MTESLFIYRPPDTPLVEVNIIFSWNGKDYKIKKVPLSQIQNKDTK